MTTGVGGGVFGAFLFDNVMSGSLLFLEETVDPVTGVKKQHTVGGFTNEVVKWGRGVNELKNTIYYFVPSGTNAGAGRLSIGMASAAAYYIRGGMKDPILRKRRYKGPTLAPRSELYQDWINKIPQFRRKSVMTLTGWSADFFGVIRVKGAGVSLGINPKAETHSPIPFKVPLEYNSDLSNISRYMRMHETGSKTFIPQRPLMSGLVLGYLQKTNTMWAELFKKYLKDTFWKEALKIEEAISLSDFGTSGGRSATATSSQISNVYKEQADVYDASAFQWEQIDNLLQMASDLYSKGRGDNENKRLFVKSIRPKLASLGLTAGQITKTIRACFRGEYEDLI